MLNSNERSRQPGERARREREKIFYVGYTVKASEDKSYKSTSIDGESGSGSGGGGGGSSADGALQPEKSSCTYAHNLACKRAANPQPRS